MKVKEFIVNLPYLCDAKNADRWSRMIGLVYDDELSNPDGPFARNDDDIKNPSNRFAIFFGFDGNPKKIEHCKKLVEIMFLAHYKNEHGEVEHTEKINTLVSVLSETESENAEIANTLTASEASTVAGWNS
jgi:hypothetical protein